jgi:hypothetical protein
MIILFENENSEKFNIIVEPMVACYNILCGDNIEILFDDPPIPPKFVYTSDREIIIYADCDVKIISNGDILVPSYR